MLQLPTLVRFHLCQKTDPKGLIFISFAFHLCATREMTKDTQGLAPNELHVCTILRSSAQKCNSLLTQNFKSSGQATHVCVCCTHILCFMSSAGEKIRHVCMHAHKHKQNEQSFTIVNSSWHTLLLLYVCNRNGTN